MTRSDPLHYHRLAYIHLWQILQAMSRDNSSDDACEVWDVGADADRAMFECPRCGWSERAATNPGVCPECGQGLRNCSMPIE